MTGRELIKLLVDLDLDAEVFIGLGPSSTPSNGDALFGVAECSSQGGKPYGIYIIPSSHLEEAA